MLRIVFILTFVALAYGQQGRQFRFDYKYSKAADGWLKFHVVPAIWQEARLRCHAEGSVLASPLTLKLQAAIIDHVLKEQSTASTIYTGVHATFSKGDYTSIEGVPLSRLPITWAPGEPDNFANSEDCLVMLTQNNGTMGDVKCSIPFPYVCYKKKSTLIVNECGTSDPEYTLDKRTGSCYKFHRRGQTWSRAYMTCQAEGAHLAVINSDQESVVLRELYSKHPEGMIFSKDPSIAAIGFHDWGDRGNWMTIHGETLKEAGFDRWAGGQPDNSTRPRTGDDGEFCGSFSRSANLNDVLCNIIVPFICEKKPDSLILELEES